MTIVKRPPPTLFDRAKAYIGKMDAAVQGAGGDKQTFAVACKLVEFGLTQSEATKLLADFNLRCDPPWSESGLQRKLKCAFARVSPNPEFTKEKRPVQQFVNRNVRAKWPKEDLCARAKIFGSGFGLPDLMDLSPVLYRDEHAATIDILETIFPGNPLICCGKNSMAFATRPLRDFGREVESMQFIVPSPMSKLLGKIQDPEPDGPTESAHTKDNTGDRKFAVVEFDRGSSDEHSALLWHLRDYAPLVMAVHSGGKSLHGWFYVGGQPEAKVFRFYRYAVSIGADRATYLKSQFVRMPDGTRDNGKRQAVYYFNPELLP